VLGGVGRVKGALFGALALMVLLEGSRFVKDWIPGVSEVELASLRLAAVGLALILITLYRPNGLFGGKP
jgi:branched-chain amino acid transport system permease protein